MKIETKFDIGQEVWFIKRCIYYVKNPYEIRSGKIGAIQLYDEGRISYVVFIDFFEENELFATKAEAEQALKRLEGKDEKI